MKEHFFNIIIIEDDEEDLLLLSEILANITDIDYNLETAENFTIGRKMLQENKYDIVLLDLGLPESRGMDTIISFNEISCNAAVIVMTGLDDNEFAKQSLQMGMHDYLVKGNIDSIILSRSIRYAIQRNEIQKDLKERECYYRNLISKLHEDIIVIDKDYTITDINNSYLKTTGSKRENVIGKKCYKVTHGLNFPCQSEEYPCKMQEVLKSGESEKCLHTYKHQDGSSRYVDIIMTPLKNADGKVTHVIEAARDITDYYKLNEKLQKSLQEKDILLAEVHHRVRNNMQIINSLLKMEASSIKNKIASNCLIDCRNRIRSMSLIHDRLYISQDFTHVEIKKYIHDMVRDFYNIYNIKQEQVALEIRINKLDLNVNMAIPCGLIINELLSNAFKHGFPNGRTGKIEIVFECSDDGKYLMSIKDNGIGLSPEFDIEKNETLGLKLVKELTLQVHGNLKQINSNGTEFKLEF